MGPGVRAEPECGYPSMRIFRQREPNNWDQVIAQVANELTKFQQT